MTPPPVRVAAAAFLLMLFIAGCGTSRRSTEETTGSITIPPTRFQYHTPPGWLDLSRDSTLGAALWLVRNDYHATLAMEQIHVDGMAGSPLTLEAGAVARTLFAVEEQKGPAQVITAPDSSMRDGTAMLAFHVVRSGGDEVQVFLVRMGKEMYALTALLHGLAPGSFASVDAAQRLLLRDLVR